MTSSLLGKLAGVIDKRCLLPSERLPEYAVDGITPQAVVQPHSREAIAEVLRWASSEKLAVVPRGGGTQLSLGNLPRRVDLVLDLSKYHRLLDYQPADLTVTAEAGMTLEALQRELAQGGKFAPLEAPLAERATVGGVLAASASGPLRYSYGLARDWLIGISVVGSNGVETKAGGKVVKNVTGYDLNKLYAGSLGTLGVIVEATLKLAPVPADSAALVAAVSSLQEGVRWSRHLLAQVFAPQGVQVINREAARRLGLNSALPGHEASVVAFFTGRARAVQRRLSECVRLLQESGATEVERLDGAEASPLLRRMTDLGWADDSLPRLGLKVSVPPSAVGDATTWLRDGSLGPGPGIVADPGFGGLRLLWWDMPSAGPVDDDQAVGLIRKIQELAGAQGGSAVVEHCPLSVKQQTNVWGDSTELVELMTRIKHKFDPSGTLNPGRFLGRL